MSLGYVKGKYWVADDRYKACTETVAYKALMRACQQARITFTCEYSYVARQYTAEVVTIEKFDKSANYYFIKHSNAYDANPMAAISLAIRKFERITPLLRAVCLEIECGLLAEAHRTAAERERRIEAVLDTLSALIAREQYRLAYTEFSAVFDEPHHVIAAREIGDCYDEDDDL